MVQLSSKSIKSKSFKRLNTSNVMVQHILNQEIQSMDYCLNTSNVMVQLNYIKDIKGIV